MSRVALIVGITGQDGSYLAELLLDRGYQVHGCDIRITSDATGLIRPLLPRLTLHHADLRDGKCLERLIREFRPHEIYNLAAQSCVEQSWQRPVETGDVTGLGVARLLEAIRNVDSSIRLFQASSSEIFGNVQETPQSETTPMHPRTPYGAAKAYAHWLIANYRDAWDMFACSGILYNHESPRRGLGFVTRKVTHAVARIKLGLDSELRLGDLNSRRDWGYASDYVHAMWLMLQQDEPEDYVIGTGVGHSVQDLVEVAFSHLGLDWRDHVVTAPSLYRPDDVDLLLADASKAAEKLGWQPTLGFEKMVRQMVDEDLRLLLEPPKHGTRAA